MPEAFGEVREKQKITFAKITPPEWVLGFMVYLDNKANAWENDKRERTKDKPLARNSKLSYFNKLCACLNQAFDERIIAHNPIHGIESFKAEEGTRMYLTIDELKQLAQTECEYPNIKKAFLFSCLTGLRRSDILKPTWGEVHEQGEYTRIIFKQKKTGGLEYLTRVLDKFVLEQAQSRRIFSSYRQRFGFVVEEAVGSQCRADVHDEVVQRAVP